MRVMRSLLFNLDPTNPNHFKERKGSTEISKCSQPQIISEKSFFGTLLHFGPSENDEMV